MGLDWNPGNKPKSGYEQEFREIVTVLALDKLGADDRPPFLQTIRRDFPTLFNRQRSQKNLLRLYNEISIPAYQTLDAPRVGFSPIADEWAKEMHARRSLAKPLDAWLEEMRGYYVLALAPKCDGLPFYSNGIVAGYVERCSFRAQFLKTCRVVTGDRLFEEAYTLKFPTSLVTYGDRLIGSAEDCARSNHIAIPDEPPDDPDSIEGQLHVVVSAGRWCRYWGESGHFLDPYF
jgi:hypothetical protein